mmetsp:Transcript_75757/g.245232  ORF Transcript_75757/g.245232 Transcript_75757/m.245232 type:complete len:267 (-) Transcript_75757:122-922(-)
MFKNAGALSAEEVLRGVKWLPYTATPQVTGGAARTRSDSMWTALMVHTTLDSLDLAASSQGGGILQTLDLYSDLAMAWALFNHLDYAVVDGWKKGLWVGFLAVSQVAWLAVSLLVALRLDSELRLTGMTRSEARRAVVLCKLWLVCAFGVPLHEIMSLTRAMDSFMLPRGGACTFVPLTGVAAFVAGRGPTLLPRMVTLLLEDTPLLLLNAAITAEVGCTVFSLPAMLLSLGSALAKAKEAFDFLSDHSYAEISLRAHYEAMSLDP